tara:strand:+ start:342 stop:578 length:237 start_codon:yes stop_codon:yes gene_type:complete
MNILNNLFFAAFITSIIFFIIKHFLFKLNKENNENYKKDIFKDSVLIFTISYVVLYFKKYLLENEISQIKIFTNDPNF